MSEKPAADETTVTVDAVEEILAYRFEDRQLLVQALTHRSWVNEHFDQGGHNERLEFLGDAVLGFVAARRLFHECAEAPEGELTRRRAAYVSEHGISSRDGPTELGRFVRLGRGQALGGGHELPSIVADATEAVIAAVYLDGGLEAAEAVVDRLLGPPPDGAPVELNPKTQLQERLQRVVGCPPTYETERVAGPDHAPRFSATVQVGTHAVASAEGASKKAATQAAARAALEALASLTDEELESRYGANASEKPPA